MSIYRRLSRNICFVGFASLKRSFTILRSDSKLKYGLQPAFAAPSLQHRSLHFTSTNQVHPIVWAVVRPIFKLSSILVGRGFRKWWFALPPKSQRAHYEWFQRHKIKLYTFLGAFGGFSTIYVISHIERTPHTGRFRFVILTDSQVKQASKFEAEELHRLYDNHILPISDQRYRFVDRVVRGLVKANETMDGINDKSWTLNLIQNDQKNAFVLPSGEIFVFTGILPTMQNEDQLATVLGHEMAHAILNHGIENLSMVQLVDWVMIGVAAAVWAILPSDILAAISHFVVSRVTDLMVNLPYSRKLENEADIVGLNLMAKACYDVRESSVYWSRRDVQSKYEPELQIPDFLSTHPSDVERKDRLNLLIPHCLKLREDCNCPPVARKDPRILADYQKQYVEAQLAVAGKL